MPRQIFGWAADKGGCGFYRIGLPLDAARAHGWTTVASTAMPRDVQLGTHLVVGQRVATTRATVTWQAIAARTPGRLIYEADDDLFHLDPWNPVSGLYNQPQIRANITRNIRAAAAMTVSTEPLADVYRDLCDDITVVPNTVPSWILGLPRPDRDGPVTIGWQGSPTHLRDFSVARRAIRQAVSWPEVAGLHVIGQNYATGIPNVTATPWIPDIADYYEAVARTFDIGVAPLERTQFNESKSHIRCLEYAALGIPVVASDVPAYRGIVEHGVTGFLVSSHYEWVEALRALATDPGLRARMGAAARERAARWTTEGRVGDWLAVYDRIDRQANGTGSVLLDMIGAAK